MITKIFLALVGVMYLGLAIWCTLSPDVTSAKLGFELNSGSGQSEFIVIYGGLELAMSLIFLLPLIRKDSLIGSLLACVVIHACLVAFRTYSLLVYSDISGMTYQLAIGEWVLLILSLTCLFVSRNEL